MVASCGLHIWFVILLELRFSASVEYYSAISHMRRLIDVQEDLIKGLHNYFISERRRLSDLDRKLKRIQSQYQIAKKNITNYLMNPVNSYTLIRSLTSDLDTMEENIYKRSVFNLGRKVDLPTEVDLNGAALAISRLQVVYRLNVSELAYGMLAGEPSTPMSACDCFEIGAALYKAKDFRKGLVWMFEAMDRYNVDECIISHVSISHIIENVCFGFLKLDDKKSVMLWENFLVALRRGDIKYKDIIPDMKRYKARLAQDEGTIVQLNINKRKGKEEVVSHNYEIMCRNEAELADEMVKRLKCSYLRGPDPFLLLAPIKMEHLYFDPDVILFHGVLSDAEIKHVIDKAEPEIKREVYDSVGDKHLSQTRAYKATSFDDDASEVIAGITQRVSDMTDMNMESAEGLNIVNYGIGGRYEPHYCWKNPDLTFSEGQRQATVMFYMSTVARGGATVFPLLGLTVFPVKGAALYWHNLHPSGEIDLASMHASCPVLRGSMWISVKWIHSIGQEFRKPCTLEYQSANQFRRILPPKPKLPDVLFVK